MMKRSILVFLILIIGVTPDQVNEVSSGDVICGYVNEAPFFGCCYGCWKLETCDGELIGFSDEPPDSYKGHLMAFVNPVWGEACGTCPFPPFDTACGWVIVGWESAYSINSCAECGKESCEEWLHVKCNVGGYKLYINGEYALTEDGDGDCGVELSAGTYTVKLKKEGCDTVIETVRIECGHETTLRVTMSCNEDCDNGKDDDGDGRIDCNDSDCRNDPDCDPCRNVNCPDTKCYGCELWKVKCANGECVKDYLVEKDSEECGCGADPCKEDSDHDGVNNCKDRCPNTPEWMSRSLQIDSEGCLYCLDKETKCAASVTFLIGVPTMGIEDVLLDFCEIIAKLADGDFEGTIKEVLALVRDILFMAARILAGLVTLPAGASGEMVVGALQTMLTCLPTLSSSEVEATFEESVQMMANENIDVLSFYVGSPVTVEVTDDRGNTLNESTREIPNSYVFTIGNQKVGLIVNPAGEYEIEVRGTESGTYDLRIKAAQGGKITDDKKYSNVQTSRGEVNTYNVEVKGEKEEASLMYSLPLVIIGILMGLYAGKKRKREVE